MPTEIIVALIAAIGSIIGIGLKAYIDYKKNNNKSNTAVSQPKLLTHILFSRLTMYLNQIQNSFSISNKGKEEVFKCLLITKISIGYNCLLQLAVRIDQDLEKKKVIEDSELYALFKENLDENIKLMETFYIDNKNFTKQEQECLKIVNKKFEKWHLPRIQYMYENMYMVCCASLFYRDTYTKVVTLFDIYCATYAAMLNDAQLTLESMNGDLHGLKFKNYTL